MVEVVKNKIINNNIKLIYSIIKSYINGANEWFWSYMVGVYLVGVYLIIAVGLVLFGGSVITDGAIKIFIFLVAIHAYMGFKAIIHDYIYNRYIVRICNNLLIVLIIGVVIELLINN